MSSLRSGLRWLLVLAAICAAVWLATVIGWQETHRAIDEADVVLFMVLLPLALFGLVLGLRFGVRAFKRRSAAAAALAQSAAVAASVDDASPEDRWRHARLNVQAVAMTTIAGNEVAAVLQALVENQALAKPSRDLFDLDGFRITLARIESLDVAEAERLYEAQLHELDAARHPADQEQERLQRCIAALAQPIDELGDVLDSLLQPLVPAAHAKPVRPSAVLVQPKATPVPTLHATVLVPHSFSGAARALLRAWLEPRLAQLVVTSRAPVLLNLLPTIPAEPPASLLDRFNAEVHEMQTRDVWLLIGIDSLVDAGSVREQERAGTLRTATDPNGTIPGEGACALVLTSDAAFDTERPPMAALHRNGSAQRERPPEHRGKVSSAALRDAVQEAFSIAGKSSGACAAMVCDGDGYGPRGIEAAEAMSAALPDHDAVADRLSLANTLGELGAATFPMLLGVAAAQVAASGRACLVAPLAAPLSRSALLAVPPSPPPSQPLLPTLTA